MQNDMSPKKETIVFGNDSVVIRKYLIGLEGGRTLDCSDFAGDTILAAHVIIQTKDGVFKPMPVNPAVEASGSGENAVAASPAKYGSLPTDCTYAGVLYRSISKANPAASVMISGVVNPDLTPYPMDDILEAFKAACPQILFEKDIIA